MRNTTGIKTIQIDRVATNAGTAICSAPSKIAVFMGLPCPKLRWIFSISTVASSTKIPTASERPPKVIILSVCPKNFKVIMEQRIDKGMETQTIKVLRQLPKNNKIIVAVRQAAIAPSVITP